MSETAEVPFRDIPLDSVCPDCDNPETMSVGNVLVDEMCTRCGRIVGGGWLVESERDA